MITQAKKQPQQSAENRRLGAGIGFMNSYVTWYKERTYRELSFTFQIGPPINTRGKGCCVAHPRDLVQASHVVD